jgi:hypothetical protein
MSHDWNLKENDQQPSAVITHASELNYLLFFQSVTLFSFSLVPFHVSYEWTYSLCGCSVDPFAPLRLTEGSGKGNLPEAEKRLQDFPS